MISFRDRRVVIGSVVLLLLIALVLWRGCGKPSGEEEGAGEITASVQVAKAERGAIANELTAVATLTPQRQADLMPKVSAQIVSMPLLVNRTVRAGEVLAVLEAHDLTAQRSEAQAALQEAEVGAQATANGAVPLTNAQDRKSVRDAQATVDNARKTYERRKVLFDEGGISKKDLEASQLAVTMAEDDLHAAEAAAALHGGVTNPADVRIAEAKARQARDRLANVNAQVGYTNVRAPFAGIITEQFQHQGDLAGPAVKMLTIADASTLIAKIEVSEAVAATLRPGDRVQVVPDDATAGPVDGTVSLVGRGADAQSRSVEVWVVVPNAGGQLRPNGTARVTIASQAKSGAVVVPSSAVTLDATNGNAGTVMVVDAQSVAHEVHVTTGIRSGGRTEIVSGLRGGETVVTEGNYGLPDGTKVALPGVKPKTESRVDTPKAWRTLASSECGDAVTALRAPARRRGWDSQRPAASYVIPSVARDLGAGVARASCHPPAQVPRYARDDIRGGASGQLGRRGRPFQSGDCGHRTPKTQASAGIHAVLLPLRRPAVPA